MFNDNHLLAAFDGLGFHFLLLAGLQTARARSLGAHALDCVHHIGLLRQKGVAQFRRPLDIARQTLHRVRHRDHRLNTWIPVLLLHGVRQGFALQRLVPIQPLLELNDLQRVGGSHQCLAQQRIGIQRDRRNQGIQLIVRDFGNLLRHRGRRCLGVLAERCGRAGGECSHP